MADRLLSEVVLFHLIPGVKANIFRKVPGPEWDHVNKRAQDYVARLSKGFGCFKCL